MIERLLFASSLALAGCAASSDAMHAIPAPDITSPGKDTATIVFMRPAATAPETVVTIFTSTGAFVGDSVAESCFSVQLSAGHHILVGSAANTSVLSADLAAGKTYFVEVSVRNGVLDVRSHLFGVRRDAGREQARVARWLGSCDFYQVDTAVGQARLEAQRDETAAHVRRAQLSLTKYSAAEVGRRTLRPEDGR